MVAVVADEVGDRRAGDAGREEVGVRREKHRVEAAPRVADDADRGGIDRAHRDDPLDGRADAVGHRQTGLARPEDDVRLQEDVAVAREHGRVVGLAIRRLLQRCRPSDSRSYM